jgi:hypothetical protein
MVCVATGAISRKSDVQYVELIGLESCSEPNQIRCRRRLLYTRELQFMTKSRSGLSDPSATRGRHSCDYCI